MSDLKTIQSVSALEDFRLAVVFNNGEKRLYDVKNLFTKWDCFKVFINNQSFFSEVKVDSGGYGISWNDDLDLSAEELYVNGKCG